MTRGLIILNLDRRFNHTYTFLQSKLSIEPVKTLEEFINSIQHEDWKFIILPVRGVNDTGYIDGTDIVIHDAILPKFTGKVIYTGLISSLLEKLAEQYGFRIVSYLTNDFAIKNNYITVEGIIETIVNHSDKAIYGSKIAILGYGKLGVICAKVLKNMKAQVTVVARNDKDRLHASIYDFAVLDYSEFAKRITEYDFIINTVPNKVIANDTLASLIGTETTIIDVSSPPFGLDHEFAKTNQIKAFLLPGIPGKIAPKTSGLILGETIYKQIIGGE